MKVKSETKMVFCANRELFVFKRIIFSKDSIFSKFDFINVHGLSFLKV